ncbi:unnamed protein product [Rotaria magnacalcarata]|uniref:Uncharacterized protein n=1 Tax=Rotaria magnacalcarata TaxID=392030 RepID=A0A816PD33_9BILA|nr:unnamed protein product [Rotaria magnacalcarata]
MTNVNYENNNILWTVQSHLQNLTIRDCTCEQYFFILNQLPCLKTFTIRDCLVKHTNGKSLISATSTFQSSLESLTMNDCSLSLENFELLLHSINTLRHLKLISRSRRLNSIFDGYRWENIIRTKLPALCNFQCFFSYIAFTSSTHASNIESLIVPFRAPFWVQEKRWLVYCTCVLRHSNIWLYTTPICVPDIDTSFRCEILSTNDSYHLTKRPIHTIINPTSDENLTELNLQQHLIFLTGARYLANFMQQSKTITKLDLAQNQLHAMGAQYMADALRNNVTLTTLNLYDNDTGNEGIKYIAEALVHNTTLIKLDLGQNRIGNMGTEYFSGALKLNSSITELNLTVNEIREEGAQYLADALRQNTTLVTLDLQVNDIDNTGAQVLIDALQQNKTMKLLMLYGNKISYELKSQLSAQDSRIDC